MGAPTPYSIKIAVIEGWLQGNSRKSIAKRNKVGTGTVSSIIQQTRNNIPDMDLMRSLAVILKKDKLDVSYFATIVRIKKVLDKIGLPEEKLETLLEEINVHCYIEGTSEKDFISKIDEVFDMAAEFDTSIWDINSQISEKTRQIKDLDKKIAEKQEDLRKITERFDVTVDELEKL